MQDGSGFHHLDHEGRVTGGQVVGRADAGEDAVNRPERRRRRRHIAAHVGQQRDQRELSHVGRFATHVRAGDQQQPALGGQPAIICDEALDRVLDHRMAALDDLETRFGRQQRAAPLVAFGMRGQCDQYVQPCACLCNTLQLGDVLAEL